MQFQSTLHKAKSRSYLDKLQKNYDNYKIRLHLLSLKIREFIELSQEGRITHLKEQAENIKVKQSNKNSFQGLLGRMDAIKNKIFKEIQKIEYYEVHDAEIQAVVIIIWPLFLEIVACLEGIACCNFTKNQIMVYIFTNLTEICKQALDAFISLLGYRSMYSRVCLIYLYNLIPIIQIYSPQFSDSHLLKAKQQSYLEDAVNILFNFGDQIPATSFIAMNCSVMFCRRCRKQQDEIKIYEGCRKKLKKILNKVLTHSTFKLNKQNVNTHDKMIEADRSSTPKIEHIKKYEFDNATQNRYFALLYELHLVHIWKNSHSIAHSDDDQYGRPELHMISNQLKLMEKIAKQLNCQNLNQNLLLLEKQYTMEQKCKDRNQKRSLLQNKAKRVHYQGNYQGNYQGKTKKILHNRFPSKSKQQKFNPISVTNKTISEIQCDDDQANNTLTNQFINSYNFDKPSMMETGNGNGNENGMHMKIAKMNFQLKTKPSKERFANKSLYSKSNKNFNFSIGGRQKRKQLQEQGGDCAKLDVNEGNENLVVEEDNYEEEKNIQEEISQKYNYNYDAKEQLITKNTPKNEQKQQRQKMHQIFQQQLQETIEAYPQLDQQSSKEEYLQLKQEQNLTKSMKNIIKKQVEVSCDKIIHSYLNQSFQLPQNIISQQVNLVFNEISAGIVSRYPEESDLHFSFKVYDPHQSLLVSQQFKGIRTTMYPYNEISNNSLMESSKTIKSQSIIDSGSEIPHYQTQLQMQDKIKQEQEFNKLLRSQIVELQFMKNGCEVQTTLKYQIYQNSKENGQIMFIVYPRNTQSENQYQKKFIFYLPKFSSKILNKVIEQAEIMISCMVEVFLSRDNVLVVIPKPNYEREVRDIIDIL